MEFPLGHALEFRRHMVSTAILDRFLHHAEIIQMTGKSYRLKDRAAKPPVDKKAD